MKKLIAIAIAALASSAYAAVDGTLHDMGGKGGTRSVCVYCHAPHKGKGGTGAPLWNRVATTTTFTQTDSKGATHTINPATSTSSSLLCLSCHDATVNLGSTLTNAETLTGILNYAIIGGNRTAVGGASAGVLGNLDSDHPVNVTYTAAGTTTGAVLFPVGTAAFNLGLTTAQLATVECASCHDPHSTANSKFLRVAAAAICTACHNK